MIYFTTRMESVIDEITSDVRDFLLGYIGSYNIASTRTEINEVLSNYMAGLDSVDDFQVICDESNNPMSVVNASELVVKVCYKVDMIPFESKFVVGPAQNPNQLGDVVATTDFIYVPPQAVEHILMELVAKELPNLELAIPSGDQGGPVDTLMLEMPNGLIKALGF